MSKKYEVTNGNYIVQRKNGTEITLSEGKHKELLVDYCVQKAKVEGICLKYKISKSDLERYRRAVGFSRDSIPVSDEEVGELSEEALASLLVERKASALERAQDLYLERIVKDATSWNNFQSGVLVPFEEAVSKFVPSKPLKINKKKLEKNGRWFVVSLSDLQIGLSADQRDLFRQQGWNTNMAVKALENLLGKIESDIRNDKAGFEGATLILAGDLIHGLRGMTEKGTLLEVDSYRATQCDAILNILYFFINGLYEIFGQVSVHSVQGNHEGSYSYPIVTAVKNYFKEVKEIDINVYSERTAVFKVSNTMIVLDHGASDKFKADIPSSGKPRESYIQSLIISKSKEYSKCNSCLFIQGDKHHYEQHEYNDFEYIMLGALPLGDIYSDTLNLHSRARQNCLIIDSSGLKSVQHYYIDQCI